MPEYKWKYRNKFEVYIRKEKRNEFIVDSSWYYTDLESD